MSTGTRCEMWDSEHTRDTFDLIVFNVFIWGAARYTYLEMACNSKTPGCSKVKRIAI